MDYNAHVEYDFETGLLAAFLESANLESAGKIIHLNTLNGLSEAGKTFCKDFGVAANLKSLIKHLKKNPTIFYAPEATQADQPEQPPQLLPPS